MPHVAPAGGAVDWPGGELAIGVVGLAPWATLDFCRALYSLIDARKDWDYPRVLIDANSKIPSRGHHLELGETDPSPFIRQTIIELTDSGAGVVVVPCNTAHLLHARWARGVTVPLPHIMEVSVDRVVSLGGTSVAVLESSSLQKSGAYVSTVRARGLQTVVLTDEEVQQVAGLIAGIKLHGQPTDAEQGVFRGLARCLVGRGADALLLGCTELGVFAPMVPSGTCQVVDSNVELARAAATIAGCRIRPGA